MTWPEAAIIMIAAVAVTIAIVRRDRRERIACARALRRDVAELDPRWPIDEGNYGPVPGRSPEIQQLPTTAHDQRF